MSSILFEVLIGIKKYEINFFHDDYQYKDNR